jgi:CRISPR/Cas system-associated endoribonuclease Cas2
MTVISKSLALATIAAAALVTTAPAYATSAAQKRIDAVQAEELRRIEEGRYKGDLTRREYRDLLTEQARIKELENKALADGRISKREARDIKTAQHQAEKHIYTETHDGQVSFWRKWLYRNRY